MRTAAQGKGLWHRNYGGKNDYLLQIYTDQSSVVERLSNRCGELQYEDVDGACKVQTLTSGVGEKAVGKKCLPHGFSVRKRSPRQRKRRSHRRSGRGGRPLDREIDCSVKEGPAVAISIEDVMTKEVGECNAESRGGRKEGDGDRESEATVARDLKGFEEGARNDTGHRWWAIMRLEEDKKCRAMNLMQGGWPFGARVQKGRPTDAEESEGKATIVP
ncbi:hypothetical protein B296_00021320 [Ensete ventricosum]|uniref:Uncharacterized protein n=1 Tax=Ensete ventricosum TaxID=4639 RepID=A0A426Z1H7_ENSVE|nr:hypothetical protein B296_00021320 [Ensete ventricosum]